MQEDQFYLHALLEDSHWWFKCRRKIILDLIAQNSPVQNGVLAEVGCGTGGNLKAFESRGWSAIGVDVSGKAVQMARSRIEGSVYHGDVNCISEREWAAIDVLLLADVLEHVQEDARYLVDCIEKLKSGAVIIITVPALKMLWSRHDEVLGHYRRYSRGELTALVMRAPQTDLLFLSFFNFLLFPLVLISRGIQKFARSSGADEGDLRKHGAIVNKLLYAVFSLERPLLKRHITLPLGVSLLCVLRKK